MNRFALIGGAVAIIAGVSVVFMSRKPEPAEVAEYRRVFALICEASVPIADFRARKGGMDSHE